MVENVQDESLGIRERKRLMQPALRQEALAAAQALARAQDWQNVTMRKVADAIGYAHPKLYELFENKDALLAELHREGFRQLRELLRQTRKQHPNPAQAPVEMALAYCNFAWTHRELYEVMHGLGGAQVEAFTLTDEAQATIAEAREAIATWAKAAGIDIRNADDAVLLLWSTLHGIASLALNKQMIGGKKHAAALAAQAVESLLVAWRSRGWV